QWLCRAIALRILLGNAHFAADLACRAVIMLLLLLCFAVFCSLFCCSFLLGNGFGSGLHWQ
ncbi:hypothetical protein U1Q18_052182, partial [Sarracenia purpurea var. burkii]